MCNMLIHLNQFWFYDNNIIFFKKCEHMLRFGENLQLLNCLKNWGSVDCITKNSLERKKYFTLEYNFKELVKIKNCKKILKNIIWQISSSNILQFKTYLKIIIERITKIPAYKVDLLSHMLEHSSIHFIFV